MTVVQTGRRQTDRQKRHGERQTDSLIEDRWIYNKGIEEDTGWEETDTHKNREY